MKKLVITEQQYVFLIESSNKTFLGYHSSRKNMPDGYYKGAVLDPSTYEEVIRNAYVEIISDFDENIENNDIDGMNETFENHGFGFTYVSRQPIESSSFQSEKYKYGDNLYKVYGNGNETLLDDVNEINADIIVSKEPLYFEKT